MALIPITLPAPPEVEFPRVASTPAEFLQWLGTFGHPDTLAAWLQDHGIRGERSCAHDCPLARLAQHNLDNDRVTVGVGGIGLPLLAGQVSILPLPLVAVEFVARFDAGRYPELSVDCDCYDH